MKKRISWLDTAKGLGIILVVLGHIWLYDKGYRYINSFHMPLFFFLSGYLYNNEKFNRAIDLMREKSRSLLIPYFSFSFITYIYWVSIERHISGSTFSSSEVLLNIFLSQGGDSFLPHNPALWFLPCLFLVTTCFYFVNKLRNPIYILFALIFSSIVGFILSVNILSNWPWNIDVVFTAIVFFGLGNLLKKCNIGDYIAGNVSNPLISSVVICMCFLAGYIIAESNSTVAMASNTYGNYFKFYSAAFLGISATVLIAVQAQKFRSLNYLGYNSLIIFGLHFPIKRVVMGLTSLVFHIDMNTIRLSFWWSILDTIIVILILIPVIYIINNYLVFIIGKHRQTNSSRMKSNPI